MARIEALPYVDQLRSRLDGLKVETVGIDFDGTLIDTPALFKEAMRDASDTLSICLRGNSTSIMELMDKIMEGLRTEFGVWPSVMDAAVLIVAKTLQLSRDDYLVETALERVRDIYRKDVPLLHKGARDLVDSFSATGRDVYLMTHADPQWTRHKLDVIGLSSSFAGVVCFSIDQPKASQWEGVLSRLGINPATLLVVGDNRAADVIPPVELGATGVYVDWGKKYYSMEAGVGNEQWRQVQENGRVHLASATDRVIDTLLGTI